jgi:hypothetical protein
MLPNLDHDRQILSLLVSGRFDAAGWELFSDADWGRMIEKARMEGVAPLLYWAFSRSANFSSLPQDVQNSLRASYAYTWMKNQKNFKVLETLSHLFAQKDVLVVLLKGACYALTIYPDIGLRPMGDLDILVPAQKSSDAIQIVKSLGYTDWMPDAPEIFSGQQVFLNHEVCLQKPKYAPIEIHRSLMVENTFTYSVPMDWFWEQTEPLGAVSQMHFEKLLVLTPVAQMLHAAVHSMLQHGGSDTPLRWYYDLDQMVRYYQNRLDWDVLLFQAGKFEWGSALEAALSYTLACFDTPIPNDVRSRLSNHSDRHRKLVALKQVQPSTLILGEHQQLLSMNWHGRFRLVLALIFPSPAYMRWRYKFQSIWVLPWYCLVRWAGILRDGIDTVLVLIRGAIKPA